jgi:hypothetical protein
MVEAIELEDEKSKDPRVDTYYVSVFSFSRNEVSMEGGKEQPHSQMSTSFLIFSYSVQKGIHE